MICNHPGPPLPSLRAQRSNLVRDSRHEDSGFGLGCHVAPKPAPRNDGESLLPTICPIGGEWFQ